MPTTQTKTIKPSGGDYTSLSAWESANQADLPTADRIAQAECYDFSSILDDVCTLSGWTTDATRYIRIYTPAGQRHTGTSASGFRIKATGSTPIRIAQQHVRVEGLVIVMDADPQNGIQDVGSSGAGDIRIAYNIVYHPTANTGGRGVMLTGNASMTYRVYNNIAYDVFNASAGAYGFWVDTGTVYVYHNTAYHCRYGYVINAVAKNNIGDTCGAGDYTGTFQANSITNLSSDTSAGGTSPQTSKSPVYVNEAGRNLLLDSSDTVAKDVGTDLTGDGNITITDDIIGTSRPQNTNWDIGASEVIAGGGATPINAVMTEDMNL